MIAVIRISGMVDVSGEDQETLFRMKLRRKYSAVLMHPTKDNLHLLKVMRNFLAYGPISKETLVHLISKRGQPIAKGTKIDAEKIAMQLDKKSLLELGLKPFFRLHPPRGGIESKRHAGTVSKGVLGDNGEKINLLIERML